jgi:hypothetical protein
MALVQVRPPGEGYEYTIGGIIGLGDRAPVPLSEYSGAALPIRDDDGEPVVAGQPTTAERARLLPERAPALSVAPRQLPPPGATPPTESFLSPRGVLKAARARAKAIRVELRQHEALKRELAELERLIQAAKQKPEPKVRALRAG